MLVQINVIFSDNVHILSVYDHTIDYIVDFLD
jgi:hypothetical protein